jgi:uncharacterized protein YecE (DUF72 family)
MKKQILVGTASWSDPGFVADWYPKGLPASKRLGWYAERLNLVEVNSSFYAIPKVEAVESWCRQTPPGFVFDVKLHKLLSRHSAKVELLPPDLRKLATVKKSRVELTPKLEEAMARRTIEVIAPFVESGKFGAFLLQLSPAFRPKTNQLSELDNLFDALKEYPVAVELRNRDWVVGEQFERTTDYFRKRKLAFVCVDSPNDEHFTVVPGYDVVTNPQLTYMRLHGRNAEGYIRGRTVAERFDYKYNEKELHELAARAVNLSSGALKVHMIYNNNSSNYAPIAATRTREILDEEYPNIETGPKRSARPQELEFDQPRKHKRSSRRHPAEANDGRA